LEIGSVRILGFVGTTSPGNPGMLEQYLTPDLLKQKFSRPRYNGIVVNTGFDETKLTRKPSHIRKKTGSMLEELFQKNPGMLKQDKRKPRFLLEQLHPNRRFVTKTLDRRPCTGRS
jgi:hypothetical protein